jgi:hypothetical protein
MMLLRLCHREQRGPVLFLKRVQVGMLVIGMKKPADFRRRLLNRHNGRNAFGERLLWTPDIGNDVCRMIRYSQF